MDSLSNNFAVYLIILHLFVGVRNSNANPIISYCTSETAQSSLPTQCHFTQISNSTFEFGIIDQNVIQLNSKTDPKYVFLKCEAAYPIRWLATKPLGSVQYISNEETNRLDQNPISKTVFHYTQAVFMLLRDKFSRKFRCESYSTSTNAADVFINVKIQGISSQNVWDFDEDSSNFFVSDVKSATSGGFIIPALASEFSGNYTIAVTKNDRRTTKLSIIENGCAECICKASSSCDNFPCVSETVCGEIPSSYFDASHTQGFNDCKKDADCAQGLIKKYWYKKRWGGAKYDCTQNGVLTCEDFFWNHVTKNNRQCGALILNYSDTSNVTSFTQCLHQKKLNYTLLWYQPNEYDPRIGLRLMESPDVNSKYEFNIPWDSRVDGSKTLNPLNSDSKIEGKLYYNNQLDLIRCEITTPGKFPQPNIIVGRCKSFAECVLKFEPLWPNVVTGGYTKLTDQFEEITTSNIVSYQSLATTYAQGYLECSALYGLSDEYLSKIDYFFTGLDSTKYLLSQTFPLESIIVMPMKHENSLLKAGLTYTFDCTISTFVLLPNIQFVLGFENGDQQLVTKKLNQTSIHTGIENDKTATLTWQLRMTMKSGMSKIICFAPWINSSDWASTEISVKVEDQLSEEFPSDSILLMPTNNTQGQHLTAGLTYSFNCSISTTDLLPDIHFVLGFENGDQKLVTKETKDASIHTGAGMGKTGILTWELRVTIKSGMSKIICFAPRKNSNEWARTEANLAVVEVEKSSSSDIYSNIGEQTQSQLYITIGGVMGAITLLRW